MVGGISSKFIRVTHRNDMVVLIPVIIATKSLNIIIHLLTAYSLIPRASLITKPNTGLQTQRAIRLARSLDVYQWMRTHNAQLNSHILQYSGLTRNRPLIV